MATRAPLPGVRKQLLGGHAPSSAAVSFQRVADRVWPRELDTSAYRDLRRAMVAHTIQTTGVLAPITIVITLCDSRTSAESKSALHREQWAAKSVVGSVADYETFRRCSVRCDLACVRCVLECELLRRAPAVAGGGKLLWARNVELRQCVRRLRMSTDVHRFGYES